MQHLESKDMHFYKIPGGPDSPLYVIFTDFRAQCRYCLYTWIPRESELVVFTVEKSKAGLGLLGVHLSRKPSVRH